MANWCENILILKGNNSTQVQRAVKAYNENRLLYEFFPEPNTVDADEISSDWINQNWGSGSDMGKDVGTNGNSAESVVVSATSTLVSFDSLTRWTPPVKAMRAFEDAGFSVELYYYEGGNDFCGLYTSDSGDKRYNIPATAAKVRAKIPDAINDAFAIAEIMEAKKTETSGVSTGYDVMLLPYDPADAPRYEKDGIPPLSRPHKVRVVLKKQYKDRSEFQALIRKSIAQAVRKMNEKTEAKAGAPEGGTLEPFMT